MEFCDEEMELDGKECRAIDKDGGQQMGGGRGRERSSDVVQ